MSHESQRTRCRKPAGLLGAAQQQRGSHAGTLTSAERRQGSCDGSKVNESIRSTRATAGNGDAVVSAALRSCESTALGESRSSVSTGKLPKVPGSRSLSKRCPVLSAGLSKWVVGFKVRAGFVVAGTSSASAQQRNNSGAILVSAMGRF